MNDFPLKPLGIALVGIIFVLAATCGCANPNASYVKADALTYEAIAPEFLQYVEDDPTLTPLRKKLRKNTIKSWKLRIDKAKEKPE